jgi:aspartate/methionine/tyrosine aminotransferase
MPRHPLVAASTQTLSAGVFSALAERARQHPRPVVPLHVGDTWREPLLAARAESQLTSNHPGLHTYSPVTGEPLLRAAIQRHLERRLAPFDGPREPRDLCVVSGATSGLSVVVQALVDPGEEVIIPAPFWPLIRGIVASRGALPVEVPMFHCMASGEDIDIEALLEAAITPRTAAIYLNTPHNPTGAILSRDQIGAFARVASRHGLWLLCDEVYEALHFGAEPPFPAWHHPDAAGRAIAVHSMSKAYGLAGARVGWAHGPTAAMKAIAAVQTHQVYGPAKPMQLGAAHALDEGHAWLDETRALYGDAAQLTARTLGIPAPAGGTFLFADLRPFLRAGESAEAQLFRCLDEADTLLTPGQSSGRDFVGWARICFTAAPPEALAGALQRLAQALGTNSPDMRRGHEG